MAMLRVHSAIGQYPLANNDAIPRNTDVIRSIFHGVVCYSNPSCVGLCMAWLEAALALSNLRPGQSRHSRLGSGLAWPRPQLLYVKIFCIFTRLQIGWHMKKKLLRAIHVLLILVFNQKPIPRKFFNTRLLIARQPRLSGVPSSVHILWLLVVTFFPF